MLFLSKLLCQTSAILYCKKLSSFKSICVQLTFLLDSLNLFSKSNFLLVHTLFATSKAFTSDYICVQDKQYVNLIAQV